MSNLSPLENLANLLVDTDQNLLINEIYIESTNNACAGEVTVIEEINQRGIPNNTTNKPRELFRVQVVFLGAGQIVFFSNTLIRGQHLNVRILLRKTEEHETRLTALVNLNKTRRTPDNNYEFTGKVSGVYPQNFSIDRVFANYVAQQDAVGWNQWYTSLAESVSLHNLNFRGMNLAQFDLTCIVFNHCDLSNCNLSGANLSGANLSTAKLEGVNVDSADLFGVTLPKKYEHLLTASGLLEKESVIFSA